MAAIEVQDLSKAFGPVRAVDDVSFTVDHGRVTGFLGPNGAGKTTTLRCVLGLVRPSSGAAVLNGRRYGDLPAPACEVGAVLEATSFHPGRTARDHLRAMCIAAGIPSTRVAEVLDQVELTGAADRRVRGFSLGMRQRLALAGALLGRPRILILDEPANGLDPAGIAWLRWLLRGLALGRECAVLVSSHILAEVQQTVDDVVIIGNGRVIRQGSITELTQAAARPVRVAGVGVHRIVPRLERSGARVRRLDDSDAFLVEGADPEDVGRAALEQGVVLTELSRDRSDLEQVFLELTDPGQETFP